MVSAPGGMRTLLFKCLLTERVSSARCVLSRPTRVAGIAEFWVCESDQPNPGVVEAAGRESKKKIGFLPPPPPP